MVNLAAALTAALSTHAPILGVSITDPDDPATWRIDFAEEATPEERAAAEAAKLAFDVLAPLRTAAIARVERAVSEARVRYGRAIEFQSNAYEIKFSEANAYVDAGRPADTTPFVMLTASAQGNGVSVSEEADAVRARGNAWIAVLAATEGQRTSAQRLIAVAQTAEEIARERDDHVSRLAAI